MKSFLIGSEISFLINTYTSKTSVQLMPISALEGIKMRLLNRFSRHTLHSDIPSYWITNGQHINPQREI